MCDGFDHAVLLVIRDASHQSEVQDHQAAIGGSEHISRTTGQHRQIDRQIEEHVTKLMNLFSSCSIFTHNIYINCLLTVGLRERIQYPVAV